MFCGLSFLKNLFRNKLQPHSSNSNNKNHLFKKKVLLYDEKLIFPYSVAHIIKLICQILLLMQMLGAR